MSPADPNIPEPDPNVITADGAAPETAPSASAPPAKELDPAEILRRACMAAWREVTDRDTPTLLQLTQGGRVRRVDVDTVSGYLAVQTEDDTHLAIGVRREMVAPLVAMLTQRAQGAIESMLAKGPAKIEAHRDERATPVAEASAPADDDSDEEDDPGGAP